MGARNFILVITRVCGLLICREELTRGYCKDAVNVNKAVSFENNNLFNISNRICDFKPSSQLIRLSPVGDSIVLFLTSYFRDVAEPGAMFNYELQLIRKRC